MAMNTLGGDEWYQVCEGILNDHEYTKWRRVILGRCQ